MWVFIFVKHECVSPLPYPGPLLNFEFWCETCKLPHAGKLASSQPQTAIMCDAVMKNLCLFQKRLNAPLGRPCGGGAGLMNFIFEMVSPEIRNLSFEFLFFDLKISILNFEFLVLRVRLWGLNLLNFQSQFEIWVLSVEFYLRAETKRTKHN